MTMRTKIVLVIMILVPLLLFSVNAKISEIITIMLSGDHTALSDLSQGSLLLILLCTLILMTIQNLFTVIPLILLISVNISLFGFTGGYIWSWIVSIAGAVVSFYLTRFWFQDFFGKFVDDKWEQKIDENGFWFVFIGRVMPFMPTSVVNIAAAISSVRFLKFFYATVIGNFIYFFFLSAISIGILSIPWENGIYLALALCTLIIYIFIRRRKKKNLLIESSSEYQTEDF